MLSKKADLFILVSTDGEEGWGWEVVLAKWRQKRFLAQGMMQNQDGVYILFFSLFVLVLSPWLFKEGHPLSIFYQLFC